MYLLELAGQSVRSFSPALRVALKPGYLVLKPPTADVPPLVSLLASLLFPDGRGGDASFIASGQKSGKSGVTLLGNDQTTYRIVRELGGPGSLHKLDRATQKFAVVTEDAAETAQFLRGQVGVPDRPTFEQLFALTPGHLPSKRSKGKGPTGTSVSGPKPALASSQPVQAASNVGAAQAKLKELERELALSKEIDQLQFRLDGINSQLFELESKTQGTEGIQAALAEAEAAFNAAPTPESLNLPKDIISRCERYPQLVQKRDEALAKLGLDGGEEAPAEAVAPAAPDPLTRDYRFWAGVGLGAAAFGVGVTMHGPARYLTLVDIPAFGFAALVAIKHIEDLQASTVTTKRGGMRDAQKQKILASFEAEAQHVREAMKAVGVETPAEAIEHLSRKPLLAEKVDGFRKQLQGAQKDPAFALAAGKQSRLKKEQDDINQKLLDKGGGVRPTGDVERDIQRTQESIRLAGAGAASAPAPAAPAAAAAPVVGGAALEDPTPALFKLAAGFLAQDVAAVSNLVKDRSAQYVTALSDRRFQLIETDKDGRATAVAGAQKVPASKLPPADLDLIYLALRLTLVEKLAARSKVPFVVEDVFAALGEPKVPLIGRMLKHLGSATQVVHVSPSPAFDSMADLVVKL